MEGRRTSTKVRGQAGIRQMLLTPEELDGVTGGRPESTASLRRVLRLLSVAEAREVNPLARSWTGLAGTLAYLLTRVDSGAAGGAYAAYGGVYIASALM
jgi:hypothetical protein